MFIFTCADGGESVYDIAWTSWTPTAARGVGTYAVNLCDPDCAAGNMNTMRVPVRLSRPITVGGITKFSILTLNEGGDDPQTHDITR